MKSLARPLLANPFLDAPLLRALESLALLRRGRPRKRGSQQLAPIAGQSREFFDHRKYHPGDDLRRVNWRAYLRSEQLVVKLYQDDGDTQTRVLLDCSRSMASGSRAGEETKLAYAKRLAAALLYIGVLRLENTILQPFAFELATPTTYQRGRHQYAAVESSLHPLKGDGSTCFPSMVDQFLDRYPLPGLAIVISDFLSDTDCLPSIKQIMDRGHELWLIQIWTPEDRSPRERGHLQVVNSESKASLSASIDNNSLHLYEDAFARHASSLKKLVLSRGGRYDGVNTAVPVHETLLGSMIAAGMIG